MNEGLNSNSLRGRYPPRKELAEVLEGHLSIFNGMNSPALIHDIDGVIVEVNETAVDRLGFDRESLLDKRLFGLDAGILPDHRLRIDDQWFVHESLDNSYYDDAEVLEDKWDYAGMLRSGLQDVWDGVKDEFTFETILERVDAERIPVENTTSLINCGGKRALLTVSREVGVRKDLEHALQEALDKQQILLENVNCQLWYLSDERTYGKVNQSHASFMGRESDEMEGEDLFDLLDEDEAEICLEGNREVFEGREPIKTEEWVVGDGGVSRLLEIQKVPSFDDSGQVSFVVCTAHDITESRYQTNLHHLISSLTNELIGVNDDVLDETLDRMLGKVGEFVGADRSYLFQFSDGLERMSNTHEWCNEGIDPQMDNLQDLPSETFPWWMEKLKGGEEILVPRVSDMSEGAKNEREILEAQEIKSVTVVPVNSRNRLIGCVGFDAVRGSRDWDEDLISLLRIFATAIANSIAQARERELRKDITQLENTLSGIIEALSSSVAMRDSYTAGHQRDVAKIAGELAERLGYSSERTKNIHTAGLLHDIGKVSIPPAILNETGELGDQEFEIIQRHPRDGYEILSGIDFRGPVAEIVLQHHERLDGTGYPRGLTSTEILPEAKILAVADSFEAMTSHRPYRPAYSVDRTLTIMEEEQRSGEGSPKYDPDVLRALKELVDEGEVPV